MVSHPDYFWFLLLLIPLVGLAVLRYLHGRRHLLRFVGRWRPQEFFDLYTVKTFFMIVGMVVFVVFTVLSLAGFAGREELESYEPSGADIVFAVDISNSMKAGDVKPSRLEKASSIIKSLCENLPGGRFGVVVFKGQGVKIVPVTEDVESVSLFLGYLDTNLLTSPGSNIESGLETALTAFPGGEERDKFIIILSDGEALSGDVSAAIEKAQKAEVSIISVGIGSAEGAQIPDADGKPLTTSSGDTVITRLDEETLRRIAKQTGGEYYSATDHLFLPEVIKKLSANVKGSGKKFKITASDKYRSYLCIALLGLFLSCFIKRLKWKNYF